MVDALASPRAGRGAPPDHPPGDRSSRCAGWCSPTIIPTIISAPSCSGAREPRSSRTRTARARERGRRRMRWSPTGCAWWASTPCAGSSSPTRPTGRSRGRTRSGWADGRSSSPIPGAGHSAGDLMVWLPKERVLFAGDLLIEDGVTMVVDGSARGAAASLARIDSLRPRVVVPGHGALPAGPAALVARTRALHRRPRGRHASGRGAGRADAAGARRAAAAGREPAGLAQLAPAAQRGAGVCGGGARVHGTGDSLP